MERYKLAFRKSVAKDLRSVLKQDARRILRRIEALGENPRACGCEKLSARERYRIRQGICRTVYEVRDAQLLVIVEKVSYQSNVCESLYGKQLLETGQCVNSVARARTPPRDLSKS